MTVLVEGGHIAEILHKATGVNPMWTPHWPSKEPSQVSPADSAYGAPADAKMLAGIMGHNLCLDIFGGPSEEEAAAGLTAHGEASILPYDIHELASGLECHVLLPTPMLLLERTLRLEGDTIHFSEVVSNLTSSDRPIAWTQHVTLGAPYLEPGKTQFRASATRSKTFEGDFADGRGYLPFGAEFDWPYAPHKDGGTVDMRVYPGYDVSSAFTTHLMDPEQAESYFLAWSPTSKVLIGYAWRREDFPWLGIWEENRSRPQAPWEKREITRGMEFGVSPMPETRRAMIERGTLFGQRTYKWIPARTRLTAEYRAFVRVADSIPETL